MEEGGPVGGYAEGVGYFFIVADLIGCRHNVGEINVSIVLARYYFFVDNDIQ